MVMPSLNSGATKAWTHCALLTPHHVDKGDRGGSATFYGKDALSSFETWNIARFHISSHPLKGRSRRVLSDREGWVGTVRSRTELDVESTKRDVASKTQQKPQEPRPLASVKKEDWPRFLLTGDKYISACNVTRTTFQEYSESLRKQDLTGFSDCGEMKEHKKNHQGVSKAKRLAAEPKMFSLSP